MDRDPSTGRPTEQTTLDRTVVPILTQIAWSYDTETREVEERQEKGQGGRRRGRCCPTEKDERCGDSKYDRSAQRESEDMMNKNSPSLQDNLRLNGHASIYRRITESHQ
jgi:hypothetical protein